MEKKNSLCTDLTEEFCPGYRQPLAALQRLKNHILKIGRRFEQALQKEDV